MKTKQQQEQKKFFTKYLPVEEKGLQQSDFKDGDMFLWKDEIHKFHWDRGYGIQTHTKASEQCFKDDGCLIVNWSNVRCRVKLFLCSRDIQVGDKVWSNFDGILGEGKYNRIEDNYSYFINPHGEEIMLLTKEEVPTHNFFKAIGEISPDAVWVKENDEFDESDVKLDLTLCNVEGEWKEADGIRWSAYREESFVGIKCPTCKHFH